MVTTETPQLRRIALLARGEQFDLVVPKNDALAHAIAAVGVHLGPGDRVVGPEGTALDPATAAEALREGGLYSVTSLAQGVARSRASTASDLDARRSLPWVVSACGITAALIALASAQAGSRLIAAVVLALAAVITLLAWALRSTEDTKLSGCAAPLLLAVAAGMLCLPISIENYASYVLATGAAGAALLASLMMVVARAQRVRAAATPIVVISVVVAVLGVLSPIIAWSPAQVALAVSGAAVLTLRALPSVLVKVDEGYHIDYGRFMVLRWTVRGRVPQHVSKVQTDQISKLVHNTEARLQTATVLLSVLAGLGFPAAALPISAENAVERVAALVFVVLLVLGMLMTSRRTVAPELRTPPRVATVIGLIVLAIILALGAQGQWIWLVAAVLAAVGAVIAVLSVSLARGNRSLGWSRMGDALDSLAIALVLPAGLLAAGTLELLRGVLS